MPVYSFLLLRLILLFFAFFFFATQHITAGAVTAVFVVCYVWQLGTALKYFFPQNSRYNIFAMRLKTVTVFYLTPLSLSRVLCHFAFSMDSTVRRAKTTKITLLLNSDCVSFFSSLSLVFQHMMRFSDRDFVQNQIRDNYLNTESNRTEYAMSMEIAASLCECGCRRWSFTHSTTVKW